MWPFGKKKTARSQNSSFACPYCHSTETVLASEYSSELPDYIKTWRAQRYATCRCLKCGRNFYVAEPKQGFKETDLTDDRIVEDEDELRAAEEELKKQADDEDDHSFK